MGTNGACTGFPGPDCTASGNATINNGSIQFDNTAATTGQSDATAAVTNIGLRTSNDTFTADLTGKTLTQGVYEVGAAAYNLNGDLTLEGDANAVFIFHMTSSLITTGTSRILFTGGAQACNVFWKVDSSATFDGATQFAGTVLAHTSIFFTGGGATLDGRVIAQTGEVTFRNTTVNNSSCAAATTSSSSSSSVSSTSVVNVPPCIADQITTVPVIIESKRVSPTSIFLSWGPFAGLSDFNVQYGLANGNWLYNTNVTGFSTTIYDLPPNQPIWIQVAARNNCAIGTFGESKLIGGPKLPNTGFAPQENTIAWYIPAGILAAISILFMLIIQRKQRFS